MICIHSSQIRGPKEQVIGFNGKVERVRIENSPMKAVMDIVGR